jgi:hypothetical protein
VTFTETLQKEFLELLIGKIGKTFTETVQEELLRKLRKLECLQKPCLGRHAAKRLYVQFMIRRGFDVHDVLYTNTPIKSILGCRVSSCSTRPTTVPARRMQLTMASWFGRRDGNPKTVRRVR